MAGSGKMADIKAEWDHRGWGSPFSVNTRTSLYNFDIDVPALKSEHKTFLNQTVIPMLKTNPDMRLALTGSASRSGERVHNNELSGNRAKALLDHLSANGVGGQVVTSIGIGQPPNAGPKESDGDRSVSLFGSFPVDLTDIEIYTDDWSRELAWDDIVGLGGTDNKWIQQLNIQATVWGGSYGFMPNQFPLEANGTRAGRPIPQKTWTLTKGPAPADPANLWTTYRKSDSATAMGFTSQNRNPGTASITRSNINVDLNLDRANWADRGRALQGQGGAKAYDRPDPMRLLDAGGVEVLSLISPLTTKWQPRTQPKWLLSSPADVFLYAGDGNAAGCLSWKSACWVQPDRVIAKWRSNSGMKALILAAPYILQMNIANGFAMGGPGAKWAPLLKSKAGPVTTILGYRDAAPSLFDVEEEIADKMGKRIAAGLKDDEWAQAWLTVNGDHPGKDTWNAVAMDSKGYWWIEPWSVPSRMADGVKILTKKNFVIVGPAPIV
jgi:hypothetical protein